MGIDLIVRSSPSAIDFALLHDGKLVELHREEVRNKFQVGDIFLAKISRVMPGLNAAFVDLKTKKDGFLHYHDLGPNVRTLLKFVKQIRSGKKVHPKLKDFKFEPPIAKDGTIQQALQAGQQILVQVVKEPISTKGPRLTSEISLAGRYLVLVPFNEKVFVSSKIEDAKERSRLKRLTESIRPKNFGLIVRTVADGKKVAELDKDLQALMDKWVEMTQKIKGAKPPQKVFREVGKAGLLLRDLLNEQFQSIVVDDNNLYHHFKEMVGSMAPGKEKLVKYYNAPVPIFEKYGIEKQIKTSFGRHVAVGNSGAYLIIEHTEAMHVIDVNSGTANVKSGSQEENALKVNMEAAREVARQLRLRDMGGIIVVDFIDLQKNEHRQKLYEVLKEAMKDDRAKHKILPPTKFGLIQITRQRVRPERHIETTEPNPDCPGKTEAPVNIIHRLETELPKMANLLKGKIIIAVHPFVAAYLQKGFPSWIWRQRFKLRRRISIQPRHGLRYLEYKFLDKDGNEAELT